MKSKRVPVPCENCGRELLIRAQNLGRIGKCTYCGYLFRAQLNSLFELPAAPPASSADDEEHFTPEAKPATGATQPGEPLPAQSPLPLPLPAPAPAGGTRVRPGPRNDEGPGGLNGHSERMPFAAPLPPTGPAPAPPGAEPAAEPAAALVDASPGADDAVGKRAGQLARLKERIQHGRTELEQVRSQITQACTAAALPEAAAAGVSALEFAAVRAECERFREEAEVLRARLEAMAAEAALRSERLARECAGACAERDRLRTEREELEQKTARTHELADAKCAALIERAEDVQSRLETLERAHAKAEEEHRVARAEWEEQRKGLEALSERRQQERDEARRRSAEQEARFTAEYQNWRQRSDEQQCRLAAVAEQLRATEHLQGRTARDRDARGDEVERLRLRLAAVERSHAAVEAERDEAHAGWEADRRELEAAVQQLRRELRGEVERRAAERQAAEQHRRALAEDAERRLAEQAARFEARWSGSVRHSDQLAALWDTLAQEVEQIGAGVSDDESALRRQLETVCQERDRLRAQLREAEAGRSKAAPGSPATRDDRAAAPPLRPEPPAEEREEIAFPGPPPGARREAPLECPRGPIEHA